MSDIQTQLPVKLTDNTHTVAITAGSALTVDGSAVTQPVSGTVTANAGTGTFNVTGTGSAGSAASGVVTVQGIASMTPVVTTTETFTTTTGTITTSASTVTTATLTNANGALVTVHGTYAGVNFAFNASDDGGTTFYSVIATSLDGSFSGTSTGVLTSNASKAFLVSAPGANQFQVAASAYTSGTANIRITPFNNVSDTYLIVAQPTAANLNATVVQSTAASLNATVVQSTASSLNATVVQGTASNLKAQVTGAGSAGTADSGVITVQGIASMTPVTVSGTVTANAGTGTFTTSDLADGPVSPGAAATKSLLAGGQFNSTPPTLTNTQQAALQLDASGFLKVNVSAGSSGNAAASATGSAVPADADYVGINVGGTLRGATGVNPTGSVFATQMDLTSVGGTSTSLGQKTSSASIPVVLASDQSSVSVAFGEVTTGIVASYQTASAVANGSTGTLTYTVTVGKTLYLKSIFASSSGGPCRVQVDYGAGPTIVLVGFYSTTAPYLSVTFGQPIAIAASTAVNIKVLNNAGSSQDVYGLISGHEI